MAESASATITATQVAATETVPAHWLYSITLNDTGTTTAGAFWFAWSPGQDYLDTAPIGVTSPAGWASNIVNNGSSDGYSIEWVAISQSSDVAAGGSRSGFSFTSNDPPSAIFGNSVFYSGTPVATSFIYSGAPFPQNGSDPGAQFVATEVACFLPNTHILTDRGEIAVEKLRVGDAIVTLSGQTRRLCWIGQGRALSTRGRRSAATPVIVRKGALGDNVPNRDLLVTKGHSLFLDGVLIPAEFLVNHRSILWDDRAQEVTVYHLELDTHDVLLANGAPAESYRDDGNRWLFQNANDGWDSPPMPACAPVVTGGPIVDAVWRRLLDRAGPRPGVPLTDDSDLHLLADGVRLDAVMRTDDGYIFSLRNPAAADLRLLSRAAVPQEMGTVRDARCLGVSVRRIVIRQGMRSRTVLASDPLLAQGFHAYETDNDARWTDGNAVLPPAMFDGFTGLVDVTVYLGGINRYVEGIAA
jgi:Hint domain